MKKIIATLLILTGTSAFAATSTPADKANTLQSLGMDSANITTQTEDKANCNAYAQCANGRIATCSSYGAGCYYQFERFVGVECTGYNVYGFWVTISDYCY